MNNVDANDVINILTQRIAELEKQLAVQIALNAKNKYNQKPKK